MRRRSRYHTYGYPDYPRFAPSRPREAKDGIKAKAQRGQVGGTWWSRRFIGVLESFRIGPRLQRGLRYARAGQVMDLQVAPGVVSAQVQGTRRTPYEVRIEVAVLPEKDWHTVEARLAAEAGYLARLLAGEMPQDVEDAFVACRLSLFPASTRDLQTSCTCPDWSNPCKHVAAVYYLLAEAFDADPFLVFRWRGRPRETLLANLRALRAPEPELEAPPSSPPAAEPPPAFERFWAAGPVDFPLHLDAGGPAACPPREAGPLGITLGDRDLASWLEDLYTAAAAAAEAEEP